MAKITHNKKFLEKLVWRMIRLKSIQYSLWEKHLLPFSGHPLSWWIIALESLITGDDYDVEFSIELNRCIKISEFRQSENWEWYAKPHKELGELYNEITRAR